MRRRLWLPALVVSVGLHAGLAAAFLPDAPSVEIAGGGGGEIALLGSAFEDAVIAGGPEMLASETPKGDPLEDRALPVEPVSAAPTPRAVAEPVRAEAETRAAIDAASADPIDPDSLAVLMAEGDAGQVLKADPPERQVLEAEAPDDSAAVPRTMPAGLRERARVAEPAPARERTPERPTERAAQRAPAGAGGAAAADARRGIETGSASGTAASARAGSGGGAGNAAVSNYPGRVVTALRRALRYPSAARGATGEAQVRFTVGAGGQVLGVGLAQSSGNAALDVAAIATVQRAAPFPPIPPEAGRSEWSFTLPLGFMR
ncbi:energy transducer TonB [Arsenicitalea aurantiaca]|uniref:Energy transducer TonB n=1 Tax=Arsenicitalea aurantiaca TaxID=1783274 RepID=A0A433XKG6_9HYPH|nr:energy transducer TonB [Arsenicitalea aurantiaca]RUT34582.1 energy transducer TonB [Arsenicitalea aurantiaca]